MSRVFNFKTNSSWAQYYLQFSQFRIEKGRRRLLGIMSGKDEGKTFVPAESEGTPPVAYLQTGGSELEVKGTTDKDTRSLEAKVETGEATGGEKIAAVEAGGGKGSVDQKKECVEARGEGADEEVRGGKGVSLHKGNNRGGDGHQQKRGGGGGYFLSRFFSQGPRRGKSVPSYGHHFSFVFR